jgi:tetratricopeptide (TPR) repeat protein
MRATRELLSPLGAALVLVAGALFFGGGAGDGSLPWIGAGAVTLGAALFVVYGYPRAGFALLPLVGLAVWCALSVAWSIQPDRSWAYANRTLVYVAFGLVGTYLASQTRALALGLAGLLGAVCAWSLAGKVLPWLYEGYERIARLRAPVGYWNALALLGAIALPLGLWLAGRSRLAGTLLAYGWICAIALTLSRGGAAVAVLVVVAWIVLSGLWLEAVTTLVAAGLPAAGVIAFAFSLPGVTSDGQSHATRVHDGLRFGIALVVGAAIAGALSQLPRPAQTRWLERTALALAAAATLAAVVVAAAHARSWWDEFTSPTVTELPNSANRFVEAGSNYRWTWWQEAWHGFEDHPLGGTGAGSFHFTNLRYRTTNLDEALEPHSLPVQFLSETGIVGVALAAASAIALVGLARRGSDAEIALGLALPAFLLHGLIDIDWDFAAVAAPVLLIAGSLIARPEPLPRRASFPRALLASGVAVAVLSSLAALWLGDRWTGEAQTAARPREAAALAERARSVDPLAAEPIFAQAFAEERRGRLGKALGLLEKATRVQPENAEAWYLLGAFDLDRGCPRKALPELERFTELNPQDPGNKDYDRALKLVNSGKPRC